MTTEFDYDQLDPGIRQTVRLIHEFGFETTDSGDGITKIGVMECALPFAHVVIKVPDGENPVDATDRLEEMLACLRLRAESLGPDGEEYPEDACFLELRYEPGGSSQILLMHLNDEKLSYMGIRPETDRVAFDPHNLQQMVCDEHGVIRFRQNKIVDFLLEAGPFDLNQICRMNYSREDYAQLMQLIGYSVSGYGGLSTALQVREADRLAEELSEKL